jgi:tripartite-type tricarboxylate transporter receptor subunit TctC
MKSLFHQLAPRLAFAACALMTAAGGYAAYPDKPITIVVSYAPGGSADALARVLAARMTPRIGANVIVENRSGASGTIGAASVAKAAPDGYTVLYDATPYSINPHLFPKMPYGPEALKPLSLIALAPNILITKADSQFKDVKDLIAKAKAQPAKINFASGGSGTLQRLAAELFRQKLGLDMVHVPYKSGGPAITDVIAGHVDFMFSTVAASSPLVDAGKVRALVISSPQRSPRLPDVPTVAESVIPGYEVFEWNGMFVPAGTPEAISARLLKAILEALQEDEVKKRFAGGGVQPVGSTPAQFADYLKKEDAKWGEVVRKGNIKLD